MLLELHHFEPGLWDQFVDGREFGWSVAHQAAAAGEGRARCGMDVGIKNWGCHQRVMDNIGIKLRVYVV